MASIKNVDNNIVFIIDVSARYSVEYILEKNNEGKFVLEEYDLEILRKLVDKDSDIIYDVLMDNWSNISIVERNNA